MSRLLRIEKVIIFSDGNRDKNSSLAIIGNTQLVCILYIRTACTHHTRIYHYVLSTAMYNTHMRIGSICRAASSHPKLSELALRGQQRRMGHRLPATQPHVPWQ